MMDEMWRKRVSSTTTTFFHLLSSLFSYMVCIENCMELIRSGDEEQQPNPPISCNRTNIFQMMNDGMME